jgi:hypothetical protein
VGPADAAPADPTYRQSNVAIGTALAFGGVAELLAGMPVKPL